MHWAKRLERQPAARARRLPTLIVALILLAGCGQTTVRPLAQIADRQLPRPARILVHSFATSEQNVTEYQGILRQQPANPNAAERQRAIADRVSQTLADTLIYGLRQLGFKVEAAPPGSALRDDDLLVDGQLMRVDEGSPLRRMVVGFGSGAALMETRVQAYYGARRYKILEFATRADSGNMPGAIATAPASAAAPVAVGVGAAAGGAVSRGIQGDLSSAEQLAAASAEQAARFLSEFFARQDWIDAAQVRKARLATR